MATLPLLQSLGATRVPTSATTSAGLAAVAIVIMGTPPIAARLMFGLMSWHEAAAQMVFAIVTISGVVWTLTYFLGRWIDESERPLKTSLVACALAVALLVPIYLLCWAYDPAYPLVVEPGAPASATFYVAVAIGDAAPMLFFWALVVLYPRAWRRAREADALGREAELLRLRASLEPHFVLNTLNTIAGLVGESPKDARRLLGALGDLFRDAVQDGNALQPLADEITWLGRYAAVMEARHPGRVQVVFEVEDAAAAVAVPRLLLQPLVENAIEHGALTHERGGVVAVRATVRDGLLCIRVEDPGPGIPETRREGARGLAIVERRIALEGHGASLSYGREDERTVVTLTLQAHGVGHGSAGGGR